MVDSFGGRYVAISLIVVSRNSAGPASVLGSAFLLPTLSSLSSAALSSRLAVLVLVCCTSAFDQLFISFFWSISLMRKDMLGHGWEMHERLRRRPGCWVPCFQVSDSFPLCRLAPVDPARMREGLAEGFPRL